jgi:hypothetical protein
MSIVRCVRTSGFSATYGGAVSILLAAAKPNGRQPAEKITTMSAAAISAWLQLAYNRLMKATDE